MTIPRIIRQVMAVGSLAYLAGCGKDSRVLHIYTWSDYIAPEVIEQFEKENNCKVVIDTFDSNETMYAKLKAGGAGYDIIMPSSYFVSTMAKEGLIMELDHSKLPNVKRILTRVSSLRFSIRNLNITFRMPLPTQALCMPRTRCPPELT